jgi:hypothetical protein
LLSRSPLSAQARMAPSRPSGADKEQQAVEQSGGSHEGGSGPGLGGPPDDRANFAARRHLLVSSTGPRGLSEPEPTLRFTEIGAGSQVGWQSSALTGAEAALSTRFLRMS